MENDGFKRLDRKKVYEAHLFDLYEDTVEVPNGNIVKWDFIGHKGAAAVVPVLEDGRILMVRQFRNALDRIAIEVPAGGRNSTEEPYMECAKRELEEETGFRCEYDDMEFLLSLKTTVAFCNEQIEIYVVRNLKKSEQHLDEDEVIHVTPYRPEDLRDMICEGKIQDGKTIAAIMAYMNKYGIR